MKIQRIRPIAIALAALIAPLAAPGAQVTMLSNDATGTSSFTGAGQWNNGQAPVSTNDYFSGTNFLRTPTTGSFTFAGNSLTLGTPNLQAQPARSIIFKGTGGSIMTINNLTNAGGIINGGSGNVAPPPTFTGNQMTVISNSTIMADQNSFVIGYALAGSADLTNNGSQGRTNFYTGNNSAFTGRLIITGAPTTLAFMASNSVPGNPAVPTGDQIRIDANCVLLDNVGVTLNNPNGGITLTGPAAINASSNMIVAEPINDGGFVLLKTGKGILTLATNNVMSAGVTLAAFTAGSQINFASPGALGTSFANFSYAGGAAAPAIIDNTSGGSMTLTASVFQYWSNSFTFLGSSSLNMGSSPVLIGTNITASISNNNLTVGQVEEGGLNSVLTKAGPGTLTLVGGSTVQGATIINNGTLAVVSGNISSTNITLGSSAATLDMSATSGLTMPAGQTLVGGGTVVGSVTDGTGAGFYPGGVNTTGTLAITGNLTLSSGSTLNYDVTNVTTVGGGVNDLITVGGALNLTGPTTVTVTGLPGVGTYTLITYNSFSGSIANLTVPVGFAASNNVGAKAIQLVVTHVPAQLTWKGDGTANVWDLGTTKNWLQNATNQFFFTGDTATFDNTGFNTPAINLSGSISPAATVVNATQNYDFTGSPIASGSLTKSGSGKLILENNNTYTGPTTITGGAIQIGNETNGGLSGSLGTGPITNNAALVFDLEDTNPVAAPIFGTGNITNIGPTPGLITLSGAISGNSVAQTGSGDLVLTASNNYTGVTLITGGTLHARNAWALGSASGGTVVSNLGQLFIDQNVDLTNEPLSLAGTGPTGSGALHKGGAGATMIGGPVTLTGSATINIDGGASLNFTNGSGITGTNVNLTLNTGGAANGTNLGPVSLGTGSLTLGGTGSWTLPATNNYTGLTFLNGGTLFIPAVTALGPVSTPTAGYVTFSGGTLGAITNLSFTDGLRGFTVIASSNAGFNVPTNVTVTVANPIVGSGQITKQGPGTLVLSGTNTFSGTLALDRFIDGNNNDGITRLTRTDAVENVTLIMSRNTTVSTAGGATLELAPSGAGMIFPQEFNLSCRNNMTTPTIHNINGTNTISGFTELYSGGNIINYTAEANSELVIAGNIQYLDTLLALRDLYFPGAGTVLVSGNILVSSNGVTPVGIIKDGTGTLVLSGVNTYSDSTTVSNGVLILTGSISSTNPVIVAGGVFEGTGTINTNVLVQAGGTLAPGAPLGVLSINAGLTVSGAIAVNVNKSQALTNGEIALSGAFTNGGAGTIVVSNLGPALAVGDKFKVFNAAVPGANTLTVSGAGAVWANNIAGDGTIQVTSTSVTHPVITSPTLVGGNKLVFTGSNGVAGGPFNVRSSTNVAAPLSTWVIEQSGTYDGTGHFAVTNTITNGIPMKFYILQQ